MTPADDHGLALLDAERAALLAAVETVPIERRSERPSPDRWSVVDIIEHVARVDRGVAKLLALRAAQPVASTPEQLAAAHASARNIARVRSRAARIEAPERVRPTGTLSLEAALEQLSAARHALRAACQSTDTAHLDGAIHEHPVLGPLTLRSWLEFVAHHDARHTAQVRELADELRQRQPPRV